MNPEEDDQLARIEAAEDLERANLLIEKYFEGIRFYINKVGEHSRKLGRLNERPGG